MRSLNLERANLISPRAWHSSSPTCCATLMPGWVLRELGNLPPRILPKFITWNKFLWGFSNVRFCCSYQTEGSIFSISVAQLFFLPGKAFLAHVPIQSLKAKFKSSFSQEASATLSHFELVCPSSILRQYIVYTLIILLISKFSGQK